MKTLKTLSIASMIFLFSAVHSSSEARAARLVVHTGPVVVKVAKSHVHSPYCVHGTRVWIAGHWKHRHGVRVWVPGHWKRV